MTKKYITRIPEFIVFDAKVDSYTIDHDEPHLNKHGTPVTNSTEGIIAIVWKDASDDDRITSVHAGMTLYLGSVLGDKDLGEFRIRGYDADSKTIFIEETAQSDANIQAGQFIIICDVYKPKRKIPKFLPVYGDDDKIINLIEYHDFDIAFIGQTHNVYPKANITADGYILVENAGFEDTPGCGYRTVDLDSFTSWAANPGSTIGTVIWIIIGGTITVGDAFTPKITVQFDVSLPFRHVELHVLDELNNPDVMYLPLWVFPRNDKPGWDPRPGADPVIQLTSDFDITADQTARGSGRTRTLQLFGNNDVFGPDEMLNRSIFCLFEYPSPPIGNYLFMIANNDPMLRVDQSQITLQVKSVTMLLDDLGGSAFTIEDTGDTPASWHDGDNVNFERFLLHTIREYSTVNLIANIFRPDFSEQSVGEKTGEGSIWSQANEVAPGYLAVISIDNQGGIWPRREYPLLTAGERAIRGYAKRITEADMEHPDNLSLPEITIQRSSYLSIKGSAYAFPKPWVYGSLAPGKTFGQGKNVIQAPLQRLPLNQNPQTRINVISGLLFAWKDNPKDSGKVKLISTSEDFEIAWEKPVRVQWLKSTVSGIRLMDAEFIVTQVDVKHRSSTDKINVPEKIITYSLAAVTIKGPGTAVYFDENDVDGSTLPIITFPYFDDRLPEYTTDTEPTKMFLLDASGGHAAIATAFDAHTDAITYTEISDGLESAERGFAESGYAFDWRERDILTTIGWKRCVDIWDFNTWSLIKSNSEIFGGSYIGQDIYTSINRPEWWMILSGDGLAISEDHGASVFRTGVDGTDSYLFHDASVGFSSLGGRVALSPYNNGSSGVIYSCKKVSANVINIYKSTDWGHSFTNIGSIDVGTVTTAGSLNIPYIRADGVTANINDSSQEIYLQTANEPSPNDSYLYFSQSAGVSWTLKKHKNSNSILLSGLSGHPLETFTYDASRVFSIGTHGVHIFDDSGSTDVFDQQDDASILQITDFGMIHGFPLHRDACLFYRRDNNVDSSVVTGDRSDIWWTVNAGTTLHHADTPSFFAGKKFLAAADWDISDYVPPA